MDKINKIYLASNSPRRYEILSRLGIDIVVCPTDIEEITHELLPDKIVCELALLKLGNLYKRYPKRLIVACDTIVWHDGKVLGKPKDYRHAHDMLTSLSGKIHCVFTGFAVSYMGKIIVGYNMSQVRLKQLGENVIYKYINDCLPMDKAGSYGIQDGVIVQSFCGDYDTIVGMPLDKILNAINKLGLEVDYETRIGY